MDESWVEGARGGVGKFEVRHRASAPILPPSRCQEQDGDREGEGGGWRRLFIKTGASNGASECEYKCVQNTNTRRGPEEKPQAPEVYLFCFNSPMEFENDGVRIEVPERAEAIANGNGKANAPSGGGGSGSSSGSSGIGSSIAAGSVVATVARKSSPALASPPPFFHILVKPPSPPSRLLNIMDNFSDEKKNSNSSNNSEGEYESLPETASTSTHMIAGAVAGVLEHCVMYPIDCVKTRMQSLQPDPAARYRNVMDALKRIVRTEGFWRPMRGLNVTATGAGPAHALYFACYEKIKKTLSDTIHPGGNSHIANGAAGCVATLFHDAAMNPAEGIKVPSGAILKSSVQRSGRLYHGLCPGGQILYAVSLAQDWILSNWAAVDGNGFML
ncbi:mitoferrin-2 isoform X4 [Carcharodon carcharias]|uniref:mitoferrin-2 isoform X4 n=1 Tax=Carcharodon carcharias TaxID=13397 RepID=UPI001B7F11BB|nr:mitoferrin-2 isoform X4 [Carcharodon carcharias]